MHTLHSFDEVSRLWIATRFSGDGAAVTLGRCQATFHGPLKYIKASEYLSL